MPVTFQNIPESAEEIKEFYRHGDFPWHDRESQRDDPLHVEKDRIIAEAVERIHPTSLLEVGCGGGELLGKIKSNAKKIAVGMDICEKGFDDFPAGLQRLTGDAEAMPIGTRMFDCVLCSEVLEHLPDLDGALSEVGRVLISGGYLLATVPNLFCWDSIEGKTRLFERTFKMTNRIRRKLGTRKIFPAGWNTHIHKMPVTEWKRTFVNAGFLIIEEKPIYIFPYVPYFMVPLKNLEKRIWGTGFAQKTYTHVQNHAGRFPLSRLGQLHFFLCKKQ